MKKGARESVRKLEEGEEWKLERWMGWDMETTDNGRMSNCPIVQLSKRQRAFLTPKTREQSVGIPSGYPSFLYIPLGLSIGLYLIVFP